LSRFFFFDPLFAKCDLWKGMTTPGTPALADVVADALAELGVPLKDTADFPLSGW
jgi:hypothetical protein